MTNSETNFEKGDGSVTRINILFPVNVKSRSPEPFFFSLCRSQVRSALESIPSTSRRVKSSLWSMPYMPWPTPSTSCRGICVQGPPASAQRWISLEGRNYSSTSAVSALMVSGLVVALEVIKCTPQFMLCVVLQGQDTRGNPWGRRSFTREEF